MIKAIKVTPDNLATIKELWGLSVGRSVGRLLVVRDRSQARGVSMLGTYSDAVFARRFAFVRTPALHNFTEVDVL